MSTPKSRFLTILTLIAGGMVVAEWLGLFNGINNHTYVHTPLISSLWLFILTESASIGAFGLYMLVFLAWDLKGRRINSSTLSFILALIVGMLFVAVLKAFTGMPRPNEAPLDLPFLQALINMDYFAFPSGHATRASILACFLGKRFPEYRPLWWIYAILIALSRLLLHVHWFSDVLFGLLLGPWVFMLVESTESAWLPIYNAIMQKLKLEVFMVE